MTERTVAILSYHKIGAPPPGGWWSWFYVPGETFVAQLEVLREEGWRVMDLDALLAGLDEPYTLPERSTLLTFDDGYRSMRAFALPLLREFGHPAVLFAPTGFIGGTNDFEDGAEPVEEICAWEDLRELERCGVSVQSHGVSHRAFSRLSPDEQQKELLRSRAALEDGLKKRVEIFAYPYGDGGTNPRQTAEILERAGYRAACRYGGGPLRLPAHDRYHLPRLAMGPDTDLRAALEKI